MFNAFKAFLLGCAVTSICLPASAESDSSSLRQSWAEKGFHLNLNATHISQYVFDGGLENIGEDDDAHTLSTELDISYDMDKAGVGIGGVLRFLAEVRNGRPITNRAGASANYDALLPAVPGHSEDDVIAVNEISYSKYLAENFIVFGGLLDTARGDANDFAGDGRSNDFFLNMHFNSNAVGIATTPDVALGAGFIYVPNDRYQMTFVSYVSGATTGYDPFDHEDGTTFALEVTRNHSFSSGSGHQTFGAFYGIDKERIDIFTDPRQALTSLSLSNSLPSTDEDTWAIYYSLQQYLSGDADKGWGIFVRAGISDGGPNPLDNTLVIGLGGKGMFTNRPNDRFGIGAFRIGYSNDGIFNNISNFDNSYGFEAFYNFQITKWLSISPDIQVLKSPLDSADNSVVIGGIRTKWLF